jgi:hypothetical protein
LATTAPLTLTLPGCAGARGPESAPHANPPGGKIHTRPQQTPDGDWDGWPEWPDPERGDGKVAYYTIKL